MKEACMTQCSLCMCVRVRASECVEADGNSRVCVLSHCLDTSRPVFSSQDADTLGKVRSIISEQLGADLDKVGADAKFVDLGADSLDTVEIMMALEEQFDITLDEEGAEKISTVQEAADMIADQVAAK